MAYEYLWVILLKSLRHENWPNFKRQGEYVVANILNRANASLFTSVRPYIMKGSTQWSDF